VMSSTSTAPLTSEELDVAENQLLSQISSTIGPLFAGFQMGSVAGHFSERAWSLAVLPLPRLNDQHLLVVNNLATFATAWSLEHDEVYVFALAQEFVASLVLSQPGTSDALRALLIDAVHESSALQGDLMGRLQGLMESGDLSEMMNNPESLLEGIAIPEESNATRAINAAASRRGSGHHRNVARSAPRSHGGVRPTPSQRRARRRRGRGPLWHFDPGSSPRRRDALCGRARRRAHAQRLWGIAARRWSAQRQGTERPAGVVRTSEYLAARLKSL
jgi:hypothetical protein